MTHKNFFLKQLRGMAMIRRGVVPNLVLAQRVIDKMTSAASKFVADETGEAMVGMVLPPAQDDGTLSPDSAPTLYVLDTISPDETAIRQRHMFDQGDDLQDEIIWWLQENWRIRRKKQGGDSESKEARWNVPLRYMGDWHKHPNFMIAPSGGDLMTALNWLDDAENDMEFLLVPIVTLGYPATIGPGSAAVNYIMVEQPGDANMRVDWWYVHRDVGLFQAINPVIVPDDQLPTLSRYPWHLVDDDRFNTEVAKMNGDGLFTSVVLWEAGDELPMEVCFMTARRGSSKVLLVATKWDYPQSAPCIRIAPFSHLSTDRDMYDMFAAAWNDSELAENPPGWEWTSDTYLIDYIHAIEDHLGIRPPEPVAVAVEETADDGDAATVASAGSAEDVDTTDEPKSADVAGDGDKPDEDKDDDESEAEDSETDTAEEEEE